MICPDGGILEAVTSVARVDVHFRDGRSRVVAALKGAVAAVIGGREGKVGWFFLSHGVCG